MAIKVTCNCGAEFQVTDDSAGKPAKCPECGTKLVIADPRVREQQRRLASMSDKRFRCAACGGKFPPEELVEDSGGLLCPDCLPPAGAADSSGIEIKAGFLPIGWTLYFFKPRIKIDGREHTIDWWQTEFFPLKPGRHEIQVFINYLFGPSGLQVREVRLRPNEIHRLNYQHNVWWTELSIY